MSNVRRACFKYTTKVCFVWELEKVLCLYLQAENTLLDWNIKQWVIRFCGSSERRLAGDWQLTTKSPSWLLTDAYRVVCWARNPIKRNIPCWLYRDNKSIGDSTRSGYRMINLSVESYTGKRLGLYFQSVGEHNKQPLYNFYLKATCAVFFYQLHLPSRRITVS